MQKKPFLSVRVMVEDRRIFVFRNVKIAHPDLAVHNLGERVCERHASCLHGLDLSPLKLDAALVGFFDEVIEASLFVLCDNFYIFGHTIFIIIATISFCNGFGKYREPGGFAAAVTCAKAAFSISFFLMENNIYAISYKLRRELQRKILLVAGIVLLFFLIVSLFMTFILFPVANKSDSMSPDIPAGSYEFVSPLCRSPGRGDVILLQNYERARIGAARSFLRSVALFVSLRKWQAFEERPAMGTRPVLRRVVALPGDTIYIDRYVVFVRPKGESHFLTEFELTGAKYNARILVPPAGWDVDFGAKASIQQITLGADEYFVLGDDRLSAGDSRVWGPVKQSAIVGKALVLYFPFSKFKFL